MVKGESTDRDPLLPCALITLSGVDIKASIQRLMTHKTGLGFADGTAISDLVGRAYTMKDMLDLFLEVSEDLFDTDQVLFPPDIMLKELMRESYQAFCSFWRMSDMRAAEMGVSALDIAIVN
jgi:hypothetical protein